MNIDGLRRLNATKPVVHSHVFKHEVLKLGEDGHKIGQFVPFESLIVSVLVLLIYQFVKLDHCFFQMSRVNHSFGTPPIHQFVWPETQALSFLPKVICKLEQNVFTVDLLFRRRF